MSRVYAILGSGRRGLAAAYDLSLRGDAGEVRLLDADLGVATRAAERLLRLLGAASSHPIPAIRPVRCDATEAPALASALAGSDAVLSALPPAAAAGAARAAIQAHAHYCDLGGGPDPSAARALAADATAAGVSVVPDCGLAPGLVQTLAVFAMSRMVRARHVRILCGSVPQVSGAPFDERLALAAAGLWSREDGKALCLREGRVTELDALTELEAIDFPRPIGRCEAFLSAGGASSAPRTFEGTLETYELKTVAYAGTFERIRTLADLGFLDPRPVPVDGTKVAPRAVTRALLEARTGTEPPPDLVVARVECAGEGEEGSTSYRIDFLAYPEPETGFSAVERAAGFAAAIVCAMQASGEIPPGAAPLETAVPADRFLAHLSRREFKIVHARH